MLSFLLLVLGIIIAAALVAGVAHAPKAYVGRHRAPGAPLRGGKWS